MSSPPRSHPSPSLDVQRSPRMPMHHRFRTRSTLGVRRVGAARNPTASGAARENGGCKTGRQTARRASGARRTLRLQRRRAPRALARTRPAQGPGTGTDGNVRGAICQTCAIPEIPGATRATTCETAETAVLSNPRHGVVFPRHAQYYRLTPEHNISSACSLFWPWVGGRAVNIRRP